MKKTNNNIKKTFARGGETKMKKFLIATILAFAVLSLSAIADAGVISLFYDLNGLGLGTTDIFDRQVLATIDATSYYTGGLNPGNTFNDIGNLAVSGFTFLGAPTANDQNLNSAWWLTGRWEDLAGVVTTIQPGVTDIYGNTGTLFTFDYTSGTIALYADTSTAPDFGAGPGSADDVVSTFIDGVNIATLKLLNGNASLWVPDDPTKGDLVGATSTSWGFSTVATGYWMDPYGSDLADVLLAMGWAEVRSNITDLIIAPDGSYIHSRNTGSVQYLVPEPASLLLLGGGLLGLAALGKAKRKRA